jgi:hypothetical protein
MLCKLCRNNQAISGSHIISQFVSEWIKEAPHAGGGLIYLNNPNPRQQDTTKMPLLCQICEERFAAWENCFKQEVFLPFNSKRKPGRDSSLKRRQGFAYSDWLLYFATSLTWRIAVTQSGYLRRKNAALFHELA